MAITWSRTFPDEPRRYDFAAHEDGKLVGRIYRIHGGPQNGMWWWAANGIEASPRTVGCATQGEALTKQEAVDAVKTTWARWCEVRAQNAEKPGTP